jgi:hypothetical protein
MIKDIYDALIACKYDVSLVPQEKRPDRKMVLKLDDVDVEIQGSEMYHVLTVVAIEWNDSVVLEIPGYIIKVMKDVEEYFNDHSTANRGTFRWIGSTVVPAPAGGSQYSISLKCMYKEEVQID